MYTKVLEERKCQKPGAHTPSSPLSRSTSSRSQCTRYHCKPCLRCLRSCRTRLRCIPEGLNHPVKEVSCPDSLLGDNKRMVMALNLGFAFSKGLNVVFISSTLALESKPPPGAQNPKHLIGETHRDPILLAPKEWTPQSSKQPLFIVEGASSNGTAAQQAEIAFSQWRVPTRWGPLVTSRATHSSV